MTASTKLVLGVSLGAAVLLAALFVQFSGAALARSIESVAQPPKVGGPVAPVGVDLRNLGNQSGQQQDPVKPIRPPQGQAKLDQEKDQSLHLGPGEGIQHEGAQIAPAAPSIPLAPSPGLGFDAISAAESFCGCYPPDGAVAAGPSNIIGTVNTAFKVWNKSGAALAGPIGLPAFFAGNSSCLPNVSDPFTAYDASANRFILGALTYDSAYNSAICVGVSTSGDPTLTWNLYAFPGTPSFLLDYPQVAIGGNGTDAIFLSGNQFQNGTTYTGARVYAYQKSLMYLGQPAGSVYYDVGLNAANSLADTVYPAQSVGAPGTEYFLAADNCNSCSTISVWKWTTPFGVSPSFTLQGGVNVTPYSQPPNAVQPRRGTITTNDVREQGAYWFNGTLYGSHTIGCNPGRGTVACVQWYQIGSLDLAPTLIRHNIYASDAKYRYFANLAVDKSGDLSLGYAYSSKTDFAGIRYTGLTATNIGNVLEPEAVMKAGETNINGARFGDYAGRALDPDGCTVWHLEEYAKAGSLWGTWVGSSRYSTCGTVGTSTSTATSTATATVATATNTPSATRTPTAATSTATATVTTATNTPSPTRTPAVATSTATATVATATNTLTPTATATPSCINSNGEC